MVLRLPIEGAALHNALVILADPCASHILAFLQFHAEFFPDKINGFQNGNTAVALAAAGTADLGFTGKYPGGHLVAPSPGLGGQRAGTGNDGNADARTDRCAAATPQPADTAGNLTATALHFQQSALQIQFASGIMEGDQHTGTYQYMVLRSVHVAEGQFHQLVQDLNGIFGCFVKACAEKTVHACHMAFAANIMTVLAATVADLYLFADLALHFLGIFQIDQGFFAD